MLDIIITKIERTHRTRRDLPAHHRQSDLWRKRYEVLSARLVTLQSMAYRLECGDTSPHATR